MLCRLSFITNFVDLIKDVVAVFFGNLKYFTLADSVDVILTGCVIFAIFKLIRDTRAMQLFKGLFVLAVAYLFAYVFNLYMIKSIFDYFFQFSWVALMIVFQPEIRNALEKVGRSKLGKKILLSNLTEKESSALTMRKAINAVVAVAAQFQKDKVGALIVFEKQSKLGEVIGTGTIINAEPSSQLIGNIFFNKAPLHDGAMIIRDGMVYAAGCILPLTRRDDVNSELGTRHRAALALCENSDAVIVVVSEETGCISVAFDGNLTRDYTRESLSIELEKLLIDPSENEEKSILRRVKNAKK